MEADLDDERGPCTECGYDPGDCDGLDHDAWSTEHTDRAPHDYEPEPEPYGTSEFLIARADLWEIDGYLTWPAPDDACADVPGWGVAEVWQRPDDPEWWPEWLETGLTLDQAVEAARRRDINLGALLGSIW
ncbi:MAG TPA: hypothetical protein VMU94_11560 [Streptosporangiaceae bacterium]|nr:hypothetical protein [Streptosporangiaceae bacterium]